MTDATGAPPGRWATRRLSELRSGSLGGARAGWLRARAGTALALQTGVAAGLAWYIANDLLGSANPFFAPIAAVITLAVSVGQRLRRTAELVAGVALGILVSEAIILSIGSGPWQIGLVVFLAIVLGAAVGGGSALIVQAASSAVLVATLMPEGGPAYSRFFDALVGGLVGLAVMAVLLPLNPLTVVRRAADPAFDALAEGLHEVADALGQGDVERVEAVLAELRSAEKLFAAFADAVAAAGENSALAPARWRSRGALAQYAHSAEHLSYALRNVRVLVRRVLTALGDGETVPPVLPTAITLLGDAVALFRRELADGREPVATRERALRAAIESSQAYDDGVGFSGGVVVAQIRTTVSDLLRATGVAHAEAPRLVRNAVGWQARPRTNRSKAGRTRPGLPGRGSS